MAYDYETFKKAIQLLKELADSPETSEMDNYDKIKAVQSNHELASSRPRSKRVYVYGRVIKISDDMPPVVWLRNGELHENSFDKIMLFKIAKVHMNGQTKLPDSEFTMLEGELKYANDGMAVEIRYAEVISTYPSKKNRQ